MWELSSGDGQPVTEAEFNYEPENFGKYFRIEVRDAKGCHAFSRAYFIEDIEKAL